CQQACTHLRRGSCHRRPAQCRVHPMPSPPRAHDRSRCRPTARSACGCARATVCRALSQIVNLVVELPEVQTVALAQVIGGLAKAEQGGSMLGKSGIARTQLTHGTRAVDQDRSVEEPIPGWRWLDGEGDTPPVGGAALELPGAPALDLDVNGRIEGNTRLAVSELASKQQDLAGVGCDLEIRSLCAGVSLAWRERRCEKSCRGS